MQGRNHMSLTFNWKQVQSYLGEMAASFIFGFAVYSAIISSSLTEQKAGPVIVALSVGLSGVAVIYSLSDITLAHFNPAITFSAIIFGKIPIIKGIIYIIAQCCGFMLAAVALFCCYPDSPKNLLDIIRSKAVGDASNINVLCTELFLTGILTFVAFQVAINAFKKSKTVKSSRESSLSQGASDYVDTDTAKPDKSIFAPLVIGFTLGFLALLGLSSSGGAFNPGLVLIPVLLSGKWKLSWAYWIGEFVGSFLGAAIQVYILARMY